MHEFVILAVLWGGLLWFIARTPPEKMQMVWLVLIALIFISPLIAWFWPLAR